MKEEKRLEMIARIQRAVDLCIIGQDWLSLERMYARIASEPFDRAVSVIFGDMLVSAEDVEIVAACHVADYILHATAPIPWRTRR